MRGVSEHPTAVLRPIFHHSTSGIGKLEVTMQLPKVGKWKLEVEFPTSGSLEVGSQSGAIAIGHNPPSTNRGRFLITVYFGDLFVFDGSEV